MALTKPQTAATESTQPEQVEAAEEVEQEQVEEVSQPAPATEQKQEVAEAEETKAPVKSPAAGNQFESSMADEGFEGLTLGGLSFEQIRLPAEGQFVIGQDEEELGKEFNCVIQTTRSRYIVRQSSDQDSEVFYSYDPSGKTNAEGVDMTDTLNEWAAEGYEKPEIKKYLEIMAIMVDEGERDRAMVMISIPPASVQKVSGFFAQQRMRRRGLPNEYVTTFQVGKKVKVGSNSWFPWSAAHGGEAPELF